MRVNRRAPVPWLLGVITILALVSTLSLRSSAMIVDAPISLIMIGLVALFVNIEVPLAGSVIGFSYAAALLVFLSLTQRNSAPDAFGVIFVGAVIGGAVQAERHTREQRRAAGQRWAEDWRVVAWALLSAAHATLSIMAGSAVYQMVGGRLSLEDALRRSDVLPLTILILASGAVYLGIYALSLWWRGLNPQAIFTRNRFAIGLTIAGPLPFVIGAALVFSSSLGGFILLMVGIIGLAIGTTSLVRGRLRYREQLAELQSLSAVNSAMQTHLDLGLLLETIHIQIVNLLDVQSVTLALYDSDHNLVTFPLTFVRGQPTNLAPRELGAELIDYVIKTKAPLLLAQKPAAQAREMNLLPPEDYATSWLGVPLMAPNRSLGCIAVMLDDPSRAFTERDQRLLTAIATQLSIAIENALLYRQTQQRASQLARLNNLSVQLSGTLEPQQVLDVVAQATLDVTDAASAAVFLWQDDEREALTLIRGVGLSKRFTAHAPLPINSHNTGDPLMIQNAQHDPRAGGIYDLMRRDKINAWVELPLLHGDKSLGILVAYYHVARAFTSDEIELFKMFANQAALAISNARLYRQTDDALDQRVEQLSALASINKELSSTLNLNNVFRLVLDRAIEATRSNDGVLLLRDDAQHEPKLVARRGLAKLKASEIMAQDTVHQAFTTGQPASYRGRSEAGKPVMRLSVPIMRDNDILGVILLESQSPNTYTPDDISFVMQLATQATLAIDNAHLFEYMQESRNRLQVILDSMHDAVILFELDGQITLANPRVLDLLGLEPSLIVGHNVHTLLKRPELTFAERLGFEPEAARALFDALEVGVWKDDGRVSYRLERPFTRFIDRTGVAVADQHSNVMGLLMVFADATEERQLAQAREDLTRMIVHDLRSPLTAINASMKLLTEIATSDDAVGRSIHKTVDVSQRALRKLLNLVNSLLDIAKMESGTITLDIKDSNFQSLAENVRVELSPLAEELNIEVRIDLPDPMPLLAIDHEKIERVLLNLVDNALKYAPLDGLICVRVSQHPEDGENRIRVEVIDNGPGVPDEHKARIFDRFQQIDGSKAHRRGTGLGLTFCRLTLEAHGGKIWIEDNPEGGSIFAFTLPVAVGGKGELDE